jgi:hypothetical protein
MSDHSSQQRSESQKAAARENGRKSRGPKTTDGKLKSRQNALKHGLAAQTVLPPNLQAEVESEIIIYSRHHKPQGEFEQRLVQKAALSSVKFLRLSHAELARTDERQRTALAEWDKSHEETATRLATIVLSPTHPATELERAEAFVAIQHTSAGLRLLAQAWDDLIDTLDDHHHWQESHVQKAARLLGYFQSLKRPETPPAFQNLAVDAATTLAALKTRKTPSTCHCSASSALGSASSAPGQPSVCHCSASSGRETVASSGPEPVTPEEGAVCRSSASSAGKPSVCHCSVSSGRETAASSGPEPVTPEDGALCVRALRQLADDERTRLRAEADNLWQSRESQSRAESPARALADATPEGQLLQRYLNDAHRTEDQALKALARHRRDQARERSEPPRPYDTSPLAGAVGRRPGEGPARPSTLSHGTNPSTPPQTSAVSPPTPPPTPAHPPSNGPAAA